MIHSAGAIDDGVLASMTPERLAKTMTPKAVAAWHLHELTREADLSHFLLFSSAAGLLGGAAQANYAAANNFCDALAHVRHAEGLPATALAWGMWDHRSSLAGVEIGDLPEHREIMARLQEQVRSRLGFGHMAPEQGLELFDAALGGVEPLLAPVNFDAVALGERAAAGALMPLLEELAPAAQSAPQPTSAFAQELARAPEAERLGLLVELVRSQLAAVLGHASAEDVEAGGAFQEMGLDSLGAVELRNRLQVATGTKVGATVVFDHPTPAALAEHLLERLGQGGPARQIVVHAMASDEPIAIVGMACRYPGGVASPEELWRLVASEREGIAEFPADRGWDLERIYDPDPDNLGTSYTKHGGFLAEAGDFDPAFFAIPPREAESMDPQERLLLEASWEALERAGVDPASLGKSPTGVFAGVGDRSYGPVPGMSSSIVSGRVSYALGLEGPAISIDTACSSSLVAIHLAAGSLRGGECTLALAGGVTVISNPGGFIAFSAQRGLAADGRCKSFAEAADGTGWAEGVGVLALERLSDAQRNGHEVLGLIKGSAVNQDGASNGLTAPNGPSQERVIRQALANARLEPKDVDAVEGHGTGTTLGDPIEAGALLATYGQERETPLRLGSIKSNIGHTQAAAGVAGVIKTVEAMRHGLLPKTLHVDEPSSHVDWEAGEIELLSEAQEWESNGKPRRAGVSSFGISGTNAHVIVEEPPASEPAPEAEREPLAGPVPLALSAKSPEALKDAAGRLAAHLESDPELDLTDVAHSLLTTRSAFEHRAVAIGESREQLLASLDALVRGEPSESALEGRARDGKLAYLLTGQGAQRLGMGGELYGSDPDFRAAFDQVCGALDPHLDTPLHKLLFTEGEKAKARLDDTTHAQPALFALEVSLAKALSKRGLEPDLLAGHSVGEIAAAHIAGVLDLPDAAKLIAARGRLMGELPRGGAMAAIEASEAEIEESIAGREDELSIAGVNSPASTVISGAEGAVEQVRSRWAEQGRRTKRLSVSHAFHSPLIEPMLAPFREVCEGLTFAEPRVPIVSDLTGEILTPEQATDPAYWAAHAREPVRFADVARALAAQGAATFLELGPDPVLSAMASGTLGPEAEAAFLATLREGRPESGAIVRSLAAAHASGATVEWERFFAGASPRRVALPTYPFQRERFWIAPDLGGVQDAAALGQSDPGHPLLSAAIELPEGGGALLTGRLSAQTHPWLADHVIAGEALLPGTAFLELALRAGEQVGAETVEELTLQAPLVLPEVGAAAIRVTVSERSEEGRREIAIHSRREGEEAFEEAAWSAHAEGVLSEAPVSPWAPQAWPPPGAEPLEVDRLYDALAEAGLEYGPAFRGLAAAWSLDGDLYLEVAASEEVGREGGRFGLHPALLDAALHGIALSPEAAEGEAGPRLPFSWSGVALHAAGATGLRARVSLADGRASLALADDSGAPVATVGSLALRAPAPEQARGPRDALFGLEWREVALAASEEEVAVEVHRCEVPEAGERPLAAREAVEAALAAIQGRLADSAGQDSRLAFVTRNAVAASPGESPDPAAAAIWGLVRSAQSEHPGRFCLIDTDGGEASREILEAALAAAAEETQLALREGRALAPRLARIDAQGAGAGLPAFDPERTVLISGGTGGLGALLARHLVEAHGARHLLLLSRSGPAAPGAQELRSGLEELGAEVEIAACDAADREALSELIDSLSAEHPLGAVVHCAGAIDDGTMETLDPAQVERVFTAKAATAWNLHELTQQADLSAFVLFSSAAGTLGGPGQGNYAAANVFCDALAERRAAEGLPATSIAWGLWERQGGMAGQLGEADLERMRRSGVEALSDEQGLGLFDAVLASGRTGALAMPLQLAGLRALASVGAMPPIFRGLVRAPRRRSAGSGALAQRLAGLPEAERREAVLEIVRGEVAGVLGHSGAQEIEPARAFQDLGFDSLAAVELRNRLGLIAGLRLPATVVFDYPDAAALADYVLAEATAGGVAAPVAVRAQASEEPIAIVGMACRYPGGVSSPQELWRLVAEGRDGISEFPADRGWDLERLYDPDPDNLGTSYTKHGGFLADAGEFDPAFFGISPREAEVTDPQQRLLLEACWQALEDAGIDPASLKKSPTGVFSGVMYQDYGPAAGGTQSIVSGRVSYTLGLEGPAISIDTACSSSLVAMHLAAQALRGGECTLALAGGVTVLSTPSTFVAFSAQRGLAADGRSKSFAEAADGVAWGEGVGVLALERLSDARRNGHEVLGLIKGSAVNQDGASNGLTAPNGPSQERVIRQALANARLEPKDVDAVEGHGTGTTLGDPIEAGALLATYGQERETPLRLGSIKSNIGHTQAAAGVAGVIKTVEAMRHGLLPKTLHVDEPSSHVDWEAGEIELLSEAQEWESNGKPRRAGVSSFGISGTNAHVIVEEPPASEPAPEAEREPLAGPVPLALSAKSPEALKDAAGRLAAHLESDPELDLTDVAHSLLTTRSAFERRAVAIGESREQLLASLDALVRGEPSESALEGRARDGKLAYLLTGQGAQRLGMGGELYGSDPDFRAAFDQVCGALDPHLDTPLHKLLFTEGEKAKARLDDTTHAQPALFALEVSLAKALSKRGLEPDLLAGHSVGEIAAAHIAGVLDLPDAAKLIAARGRLMGELPRGGAMAAIEASEAEIEESIAGREDELSIAGVNSPASTVISGAEGAVEQVRSRWAEQGRRTKRLSVSHAFHSPLIEPMLAPFREVCEGLTFAEPRVPIVSDLTGEILTPEQATDPAYWAAHAREPVRFADVARALAAQGAATFLELGPDPVLSAMASGTLGPEAEAAFLATLREGRPESGAIVRSLAAAHASGATVEWERFFAGASPRRVALPTYPFQRQRFWAFSGAAAGDVRAAGIGGLDHPLLGAAVELADRDGNGDGLLLTGRVSLSTHPWLSEHRVAGAALLPGTAFLELALQAGEQAGAERVEELTMEAPLALPEEGAVVLQVAASAADGDGRREVEVRARPEAGEDGLAGEGWTVHARGAISRLPVEPAAAPASWPPPGTEPIDVSGLHELLAAAGLEYGPAFQGLRGAWLEGDRVHVEVALPEQHGHQAGRFALHPALLDAALHGIGLAGRDGGAELPFSWAGVSLHAVGADALRATISPTDGGVSLALADGAGEPVATIGKLALRPLSRGALDAAASRTGLLELVWTEVPLPEAAETPAGVEVLECAVDGSLPPDEAARRATLRTLDAIREWLADDSKLDARLAVLTRDATAAAGTVPDLAAAAVWGLVRSAQTEHPDRLCLVDTDGSATSEAALDAVLVAGAEEPQLALRDGLASAPRVLPARDDADSLLPPPGPWRLDAVERGSLESLALVPAEQQPLGPREVRVAVRAAGLNFRDVLIALGVYPGEAPLGAEGAGVVLEVGAEIADLAPGERVMGLLRDGFGPIATGERESLARVPDSWSDVQAAALPIVWCTARYGLHDLADLKRGERVLVHAGAGGVGSAAIQLARAAGAEVFATASPGKWDVLREAGLDDEHIASSRDLSFREKFLAATAGEGVDVVLNALAGEFVDASLDLLPRGGRFLEMGKTDVRDADEVAGERPGVSYMPFDVVEAGPQRTGEMLAEIAAMVEAGEMRHARISTFDLRKAPRAFRELREGRNVGKLVLTVPRGIDPERTVLLSGATGGLGVLVARRLVERHGARRLLLLGRRGPAADGAEELRAELEALGAEVEIVACDLSDRESLRGVLDSIPPERPLGAVVHAAGAIADGVVETLTAEQVGDVFAPKVDAAWNLHELTAGTDLSAFVLFSSIAGTIGGAGQANYAAANVFLDALAERRRAEGLPATSIAWGMWERTSGMTAGLGDADRARLGAAGLSALSDEQGLEMLDAALAAGRAGVVATPLDLAALRALAAVGAAPAVFRGLVRSPRRRAAASGSLAGRLAGLSGEEREAHVLDLVRSEVASVLGHSTAREIDPETAFQDLGFDSLAAVELRNRLGAIAGMRLSATVVFDYPTAAALSAHLSDQATEGGAAKRVAVRAQVSEEPIAVVGMACRYPGGIESPSGLWKLVAEGGDGISEIPADRGWDLGRLLGGEGAGPGMSVAREGGFLAGVGDFDADFFSISPREALVIDPQERLLLESSWEALEDAGIDPASLRRSDAGVFAGVMNQEYGPMSSATSSVVSGRVSYVLGLEGPAISIDTACSSSLVAMHLAAQALRQGECGLALAGGVTVLSTPGTLIAFSAQGGMAPDGRSKAFAEAADGVAWGEGVGMLVLERLSDAERNGHEVLALIKGSAVNQDGASNGLTAPNGPSQERVIRQALANAGLEPRDVDAVEAHGTGTTLGDPIEAGALLATYGQDREAPLRLGSVKSNIGHTQAAAGVAGVIKMVEAMRAGVLPKTLHVDAPSSHVDWEAGEIELLSEAAEWRPGERPRRAGVSSFGISGTNAHVIVEEPPASEPAPEAEREPLAGPVPLALSAKSPEALKDAAGRLAAHLESDPELDLTDVAHSLLTTRSSFEQRAVAVGETREQLLESLASLEPVRARDGKLAYLLTGQGAQRLGMGRGLYESDSNFKEALDQVSEALDPHLDIPLQDLLSAEGEQAKARLEDTTYAQPALFALEVSLARALEARGLAPDLLAGHSVGEIAAAHISGVLGLQDAAKLIAARGRLMGGLPSGGAMAAIEASEAEIEESIAGREDELSIAGVNSPASTVISGAKGAVEQVRSRWAEQGRRTKRLSVSHAFHSPLIEPMLAPFREVCEGLTFAEPRVPIVSDLTGEILTPEQATDPAYWAAHAREPVRFADVARALAAQGAATFLELGPDPVLSAMASGTLGPEAEAAFLATLREGRPESGAIVRSLAAAHASGATVEWERFFAGASPRRVALPTYPFQRQRFWIAPDLGGVQDAAALGQSDPGHPLLGAAIELPEGGGALLTGRLSAQTHPWLADHVIAGEALLPGTAFLELALRAGEQVGAETVEELTLQAPLVLPEVGAAAIRVTVSERSEEGRREIAIHSRREGEEAFEEAAWSAHAEGVLSEAPVSPWAPQAWPPPGAEPLEVDRLYDALAKAGLEYGPAFRGLAAAWSLDGDLYLEVAASEEVGREGGRFGLHPALLDAALHGIALSPEAAEGEAGPRLPFSWSGVALHAAGATGLRARVSLADGRASLALADDSGAPVATVGSLALRAPAPEQARGPRDALFGLEWREVALAASEEEVAVEVHRCEVPEAGERPLAAREAVEAALAAIQGRLADSAGQDSRLAFVTRNAVAASPGESPDPAAAAIWGLVRSAQSEHPGRFCLIDTDGGEASREILEAALAAAAEETQLALREGRALAPRLARIDAQGAGAGLPAFDPERTVLISGGTGGLGALLARHLVEAHGARHLLLLSRSGPAAPGAQELRSGLEELGAEVEIAACDAADREALSELIDSLSAEHPLGAVVHCAGAIDDGTMETLDPAQVERVFTAKAATAWNLHELTQQADLSAFVLFSSAAGTLGGPGQGNYAAANVFCDALAERRAAEGLPATSIAWGLWERQGGMAGQLGEADLERMRRSGVEALSDEQGLGLFDAVLASGRTGALAMPLQLAGLRALASVGAMPPIFRGLVRAPRRRSAGSGALAQRLAGLPEAERREAVLEIVRGEVAGVLGHSGAQEIEPARAFQDLGFDSLAAVELRNRLGLIAGLRLPATVVFDYPDAAALADYVLAEATAGGVAAPVAVRAQACEEPIAIVGMACRYPGGVSSPQELWRLVAEGRDGISEFPADRGWDLERLYDPDPDNLGTSYTKHGGFLADAGEFDPAFFGISPREAEVTDPQQRLLLEACWQALEDAGIDPASLKKSPTGVFSGVMYQDYGPAAGGTQSIVCGRVSYTLGLEGPAISIDTACSSSLVAMHLAAQALRGGECTLALAGGVTVLSTPTTFVAFSAQRGLAPDGRSKSFAEAADGVAWAEGVGVLALERLSDAHRNGHEVLGLIKGSAVNQDGASNGLTAPNGPSQERVIRQALANARLEPKDVDAVEGHGTGTTLGDPIEAGALLATYGQERETPLRLGSIKSNIGHTQAAAGVAGVIKMVEAMRQGVLPKTLHVDRALLQGGLGGGGGRAAERGPGVGVERKAQARRRLLLRHLGHQRPRGIGGGPRRGAGGGRGRCRGGSAFVGRLGAPRPLGQTPEALAECRRAPRGLHRGRHRARSHRRRPLPRSRPAAPSSTAQRRSAKTGTSCCGPWARSPPGSPGRAWRRASPHSAAPGLPLPRPGRPGQGHGHRPARLIPLLRRADARVRGGPVPPRGVVPAGGAERPRRGVAGAPGHRPARPVGRDGLPGEALAGLRGKAPGADRPLPGGDRRRPHRRRALPRRRRPPDRPQGRGDGGDRRARRHALGLAAPRGARPPRGALRATRLPRGPKRPRLPRPLRGPRGPGGAQGHPGGRGGEGQADRRRLRRPLPPDRGLEGGAGSRL